MRDLIEFYLKQHDCFLHGISIDGEIEIEEPTAYTLILDCESVSLLRNGEDMSLIESVFEDKHLDFLQALSKAYRDVSETEKIAEKDFTYFEGYFEAYKKAVLG